MGDLISRQDAIDLLAERHCNICPYNDHRHNSQRCNECDYKEAMDDLEELPPAQLETSILTVTVAPDSEEIERVVRKIKDAPVMALPSAQPERTCVNCGRTVNNGGWYADGGTRCPIEEHYALPKDGYCHLWEKRNVTDDDYPERRTDE